MPKYFPIDIGLNLDAGKSDLLRIDYGTNYLSADFILLDDEAHCLRVKFDADTIIRLLDEMPLSTEDEPSDVEGLIPHHFAYRVEGAVFAQTQSTVWLDTMRPAHYRFVTGSVCMDVLAAAEPNFKVVPTDKGAKSAYFARWD